MVRQLRFATTTISLPPVPGNLVGALVLNPQGKDKAFQALDSAIPIHLVMQVTSGRQDVLKVIDHRSKASRSKVASVIKSYFAKSQCNKVFPVRRTKDKPGTPQVMQQIVMQMARTNEAKQSVKLIDGQNGGRRVVDRWRQSLNGNIYNHANRKRNSCSIVRAGEATWERSLLSSILAASPYRRNKGLPVATKSPMRGTNSTRPSARRAIPTSNLN